MKASVSLLMALILSACGVANPLPEHPDDLEFGDRPLHFPDRMDFRHTLGTGDVVYVVEDHSLPLVRITLVSRGGSYLLNRAEAGRGVLTASLLRDGGTTALTPDEVDERLDYLATGISFSIAPTLSQAGLDTLTDNLDESLDLMFDMLVEPRMDPERLAINKDRVLEQIRRRNDDTRSIEPRVWSELLYGADFFLNNRATQATLEAITGDDLRAFGRRVFARGNLVIAVSGDVDRETILAELEERLARLPEAGDLPAIPDTPTPVAPGLYGVDKDDVNQTRVSIGHAGPKVGHPDEFAIHVMNHILGAGGFTSRITSRVRSDEGLAYSAGSAFAMGRYYPGEFRAFFQSRNERAAEALAIVLEEIERIRSAPVSEQELSIAIEARIADLADLYSSATRSAIRFATDEINDEHPEYWRQFEARVRAVTGEDVLRVAREHLNPDQLRILAVGPLEKDAVVALESAAGGALERIPLKDPLTLEPMD